MQNEYRGLILKSVESNTLNSYLELFSSAFPNFKTSATYLDWLYFQNPNGEAVGFDAFDGDMLVAHYVCIPIKIDVFEKPALLALNTATHPKYQGRGLLKVLANNTYEKYSSKFSCVVGVANAQAIKPLTRHLDFEHIGDLELRFGLLSNARSGRRVYSVDEVIWRSSCPGKPLSYTLFDSGTASMTRRLFGFIPVTALCPVEDSLMNSGWGPNLKFRIGITLDWRRGSKPWVYLPRRLKPSPLSFVFRALSESDSSKLEAWTFPDFDAL
jgi:hypothetical protein